MTKPSLPRLPEALKARLLAAGVRDAATLQAALNADAELRADYQAFLIDHTLQTFAGVADGEALAALVERSPILLEPAMMDAVQTAIGRALAVGDEASATALAQRLAALRRLKAGRASATPLQQALVAFVRAEDEDAARAAFVAHRQALLADEAETLLHQHFQAEDAASERFLVERRELLHLLRLDAQD